MSSRLVYGSVARSINSLVTPWSPSLIELAWLMIMKVLVESFDCLLMKGRERGPQFYPQKRVMDGQMGDSEMGAPKAKLQNKGNAYRCL